MSTNPTAWVIVRHTDAGLSVSREMTETTARLILRTLPAAMRQEGLEDTELTDDGLRLLERTTGRRVAWATKVIPDDSPEHVERLTLPDAIEQTRQILEQQRATQRGIEAVLVLVIVACALLWLVR